MLRSHSGFTLVELLVAMASGALLLASLSQALGYVREGWERSLVAGRELAERRVLMEALSRTLKAGVAATPDGKAGGLWGDGTGLEILIFPPQSGFSLGRMMATVVDERQADGSHSLVLSLHPSVSTSRASDSLGHLSLKRHWILAAGLKGLKFRYLGGEDEQPRDTWRDRGVAPELVEIHGEYLDSSKPQLWLAVRPRIVLPGECNIDWTSLKCRAS